MTNREFNSLQIGEYIIGSRKDGTIFSGRITQRTKENDCLFLLDYTMITPKDRLIEVWK